MPELPEVETMVRGLRPALVGRTILEARVLDPFLLETVGAREFERHVTSTEVGRVQRRGKWVVIELTPARGIIVIQPRMTGGFWLIPPDRPEHARLTFRIDGTPSMVWFCDTRRLGRIAWYAGPDEAEAAFGRAHGPDALAITTADLHERLKRTDRSIKPALMDQKVLAGLGNIYADEVLHHAEIHPERVSSRLRTAEVDRIVAGIRHVLNVAIAAEGASFDRNYRTVLGAAGGFLDRNAVYGRGGLPCPRCGGAITRAKIAGLSGRSTHFCPRCQRGQARRRSPG